MKKRTKTLLSLILSAAMAFTLNLPVSAGGIDAGIPGSVMEDEAGSSVSVSLITSSQLSVDRVLSDNASSISENIKGLSVARFKAGETDYFMIWQRAITFNTYKPGSKGNKYTRLWFAVPFEGASVSEGDLIKKSSYGGNDHIDPNVSANIYIPSKIKLKAAKGATVALDGKPYFPAAKSTYLASVTFDKDEYDTPEEELLKAIEKSVKDQAKAIKNMKTEMVSANSLDQSGKAVPGMIAVYPLYIGNNWDSRLFAADLGLLGADDIYFGKKPDYIPKLKNGVPNRLTVVYSYYIRKKNTTKEKKMILKPVKKPGSKRSGYENKVYENNTGFDKWAPFYVEAVGNFAGRVFFKTK